MLDSIFASAIEILGIDVSTAYAEMAPWMTCKRFRYTIYNDMLTSHTARKRAIDWIGPHIKKSRLANGCRHDFQAVSDGGPLPCDTAENP